VAALVLLQAGTIVGDAVAAEVVGHGVFISQHGNVRAGGGPAPDARAIAEAAE